MKNLFYKLVALFVVYYFIQFLYSSFSKGYEKEYVILNKERFEIKELYTANRKKEVNNYFIDILVDNEEFSIQTYADFNKRKKIISNLHYYKDDNYSCIYPEFINDKQLFDVICKTNDGYINYTMIENKPSKLVSFVDEIKKYKSLDNKLGDSQKLGFSNVYKSNIISNHYISLSNYKGIDLISKNNIKSIFIFEKDIYKRPISYYVGKKYITAEYGKNLYFNKFFVIDLVTGKTTSIKSNNQIDYNSYFMGQVGESVYLIDKTNKKQYEINLSSSSIIVTGDIDSGARFYNNGKWTNISMNEAVKEEKKLITTKTEGNTVVYKDGNKLSGYNYYFVTKNNKCDVYRANVQDDNKKLYLFSMNDCNNQVFYLSDYIYYIDGDRLNYYSDKTGVKTLLINEELKYNNNILVGGYKSAK